MPESARRRFVLSDALILVAATACGLAPFRNAIARGDYRPLSTTSAVKFDAFINRSIEAFTPLMLAWTVAVLILNLRQPRPMIRQLAQQPGAIAAAAVVCWASIDLASVLPCNSNHLSMIYNRSYFRFWSPIARDAVPVVITAWLVLALTGQWKAEPTWLDRLGRALGSTWIVMEVLRRVPAFL